MKIGHPGTPEIVSPPTPAVPPTLVDDVSIIDNFIDTRGVTGAATGIRISGGNNMIARNVGCTGGVAVGTA